MDADRRIAEIQEFLTFAMVEWPKLRPSVLDNLARRCSRCILSERCAPLIDGVCAHCLAAEQAGVESNETERESIHLEQQLNSILEQYSGKGVENYDALILFSGGKDSAYLLYRLRRDYPELRLLALTVDNGFFSRVAMDNCRRILERIEGVDHLVYKPEKGLYIKTFRHAFTHLGSEGCYATVDRMDGDLTFDIGRNLAASLNIPLLIAGLSPEQVQQILGLSGFESRPDNERKARTESANFRLAAIYEREELGKYWWNGAAVQEGRVPRVIYPFSAWRYDEDLIRTEVVSLGLIERGQDNPLVTNNDTIPVMLAVDCCRIGYSSFEPEFAELVRRGRTVRAPWLAFFESLEYLSPSGRFLPCSIAETLGRLKLTHSHVGLPA